MSSPGATPRQAGTRSPASRPGEEIPNVLEGVKKGDATLYALPSGRARRRVPACARIVAVHSIVAGFSRRSRVACTAAHQGHRDRRGDARREAVQPDLVDTLELGKADGSSDRGVRDYVRRLPAIARWSTRDTWCHDEVSAWTPTATASGWNPRRRCSCCTRRVRRGNPRDRALHRGVHDRHPHGVQVPLITNRRCTGADRLDHGALMHRLGPARTRHHGDVRGRATYPDAGRSGPSARAQGEPVLHAGLAAHEGWGRVVTKYDRSSIRILGSVGEPINPEAWRWYYQVVGESRCPIVDTYWQTEPGS